MTEKKITGMVKEKNYILVVLKRKIQE